MPRADDPLRQVRSGSTLQRACTPPNDTRKPVMTSSKTSKPPYAFR